MGDKPWRVGGRTDDENAARVSEEFVRDFFDRARAAQLDLKKIAAEHDMDTDVTEVHDVGDGQVTITGHPDLVRLFTERYMTCPTCGDHLVAVYRGEQRTMECLDPLCESHGP